jgi:hypothetical protein
MIIHFVMLIFSPLLGKFLLLEVNLLLKFYKRKCTKYNIILLRKYTPQCPKEQIQKEKQRTTKHTHKTKDRETGTPLKTGGEPKHCILNIAIRYACTQKKMKSNDKQLSK